MLDLNTRILDDAETALAGNPVDSSFFYLPVLIILVTNTLFFFYCQYKKDNGYVDVLWGITFVLPMAGLILKRM